MKLRPDVQLRCVKAALGTGCRDASTATSNVSLALFVAAGVAVVLGGPAATRRALTFEECDAKVAGAERDELAALEYAAHAIGGETADRVWAAQRKAAADVVKVTGGGKGVLYAVVGSSPDKVGFILRHRGLRTATVLFSRVFMPNRDGALDTDDAYRQKKLRQFKTRVVAPLRKELAALPDGEACEIAFVDYADTGNTFAALFAMLEAAAPDLAARSYPVIMQTPRAWSSDDAMGINLASMRPRARVVIIPGYFWLFSKLSRCVPAVGANGKTSETTAMDAALCNAARMFVAHRLRRQQKT